MSAEKPVCWLKRHKTQEINEVVFDKAAGDAWVSQFEPGWAWLEPLTKQTAQQAQQEPVAWQVEVLIKGAWTPMGNPQRDKDRAEKLSDNPSIPKECRRIIELYTSPPKRKWVGLTDDEVMASWEEIRLGEWAPGFYAVIEAKLKERNT